jgi:tetratricopeptide (TPR) repeat protein
MKKIIEIFICFFFCFSLSNCTVRKLILKKDFDGALKISDRKIMHHRNNLVLYQQRMIIQILKKDYESALEDANKSIVLQKRSILYLGLNKYQWANYNNRGLIYNYLGEDDLALKDFETSLKLKKKNNISSINKAVLFYCKNDVSKAIDELINAKKLRSINKVKSDFILGFLYAKNGDCLNANNHFKMLKNKEPLVMKILSCDFCAPVCPMFNYEELNTMMKKCQP